MYKKELGDIAKMYGVRCITFAKHSVGCAIFSNRKEKSRLHAVGAQAEREKGGEISPYETEF